MKELTFPSLQPQLYDTAITLENVSLAYQQERLILDRLNLTISTREKVAVVGPNGAGKTTLFLAICGLLSPLAGKIYLFNRQAVAGEFRPEIGFVFQHPDDQLFCPTVKEDIAFGPENMGLSPTEVEKRVQKALALTGVSSLAERIPHQLSGGEKCMVAIASVLAMQPQLIIYDEPSANLDLQARRRLIQFLQQTPETLLISTHDLELILEVCDRVLLLNYGRIIADGLPQEVMGNEQLMTANNLEVPYSLKHRC